MVSYVCTMSVVIKLSVTLKRGFFTSWDSVCCFLMTHGVILLDYFIFSNSNTGRKSCVILCQMTLVLYLVKFYSTFCDKGPRRTRDPWIYQTGLPRCGPDSEPPTHPQSVHFVSPRSDRFPWRSSFWTSYFVVSFIPLCGYRPTTVSDFKFHVLLVFPSTLPTVPDIRPLKDPIRTLGLEVRCPLSPPGLSNSVFVLVE